MPINKKYLLDSNNNKYYENNYERIVIIKQRIYIKKCLNCHKQYEALKSNSQTCTTRCRVALSRAQKKIEPLRVRKIKIKTSQHAKK